MSENIRLYSKAARSSLENAEQWLKDARLLLEHGSFGHANALIRYAVEEGAKALVCWYVSEEMWPVEHHLTEGVFWDHRAKTEVFLGFLSVLMLRKGGFSRETLLEQTSEISEEQISESLELLKRMVASSEKMRQRAIYVKLKEKEVGTPLEIREQESKSIFIGAEFFLRTVRYLFEELSEAEKMRFRRFLSEPHREEEGEGSLTA